MNNGVRDTEDEVFGYVVLVNDEGRTYNHYTTWFQIKGDSWYGKGCQHRVRRRKITAITREDVFEGSAPMRTEDDE